MSAFKNIYSPAFYSKFAACLSEVLPSFDEKQFIEQVFTPAFEQMELKERMRHTTLVLHEFFPRDFKKAARLIKKLIPELRKYFANDGLAFIILPDYVEIYGIDDLETSVDAMEYITQFVSCEFGVRPFLLKYGQRMIDKMKEWSLNEHANVRRLASEGSRPRLPWGMAIPALKKDPTPILPILENLKNDPSDFVRRSVANNLNDIAKDNPEVVLRIAQQWKGHSKETDAIIKHGSRTLLKQGHPEILNHYGLSGKNIAMAALKILTPEVKIGNSLEFSFKVVNNDITEQKVRLEYAVYYMKQNGQPSKKVFKISERTYQPGESALINRKQKFVLITTRTFYVGKHKLSVIINGEEKGVKEFVLVEG